MQDLSLDTDRSRRFQRLIEIVQKYESGVNVDVIAADYRCSRTTIFRIARIAGLPRRQRGFSDELKTEVIRLYKDNVPIKEIKDRCGVSLAYISKTATEAGINRKQDKRRCSPSKDTDGTGANSKGREKGCAGTAETSRIASNGLLP